MAFNVTIKNKTTEAHEGQYGPYDVTTVTYDFKGASKTLKIFPSHLKKYPNLKEQVDALQIGANVGFETAEIIKPDGVKSSEICAVVPASAVTAKPAYSAAGKKAWTPTSSPDKDIGMQVGNALTNACVILGQGATLDKVESTVWELILLGERTKERIKNGEHIKATDINALNAASNQGQQAAHSYDDQSTQFSGSSLPF